MLSYLPKAACIGWKVVASALFGAVVEFEGALFSVV